MYLKDKTSFITLRLSERDNETLANICKRMNKNKSDLLRFIIRSYLIQIERVLNENNKSH